MNDHVHDFADTDTVTVREIRDAFRRILPDGRCQMCGAKFHGNDPPSEYFLRDISEHREPEYPRHSVWKDDNGVIWQRTSAARSRYAQWLRMGMDGIYGDSSPKRPLRRMDVT